MKLVNRASLSLALVAAVLLCTPVAQAQITRSSITGQVTDEAGQTALPGAAVTAVHDPTGTQYSVITDSQGRFSIQNVRPGGPYTVTVEMDGFETGTDTNVQAALGESTYLTFGLQLANITEVLTVVGSSDLIINPGHTGAASNVSTEALENLPSIGRELTDFARTNPFFSASSNAEDPDFISVAGRSGRYNNIQIDGSVNNDLFGLAAQGTPGGQANTSPISLDAIEEVQLVLADFDVRNGGFSGGSINAVTRSGTNKFKGSVFYYTRDDGLVGDGPKVLGDFGTFDEDVYGFRVGGPISQDKIFFFVNGEREDSAEPTGWSLNGDAGQCFANCTLQAETQRFINVLQGYGYDPGALGQNSREQPSDKVFVRFDFNLKDRHQLTLRHNYVDAENDINRPNSGLYEWPSETYFFTNSTNSTVLQLNSVFGSTMFNEFRLANQKIEDRRTGKNGIAFPHINVTIAPGFDFDAGTEQFSTRNSLDQDIQELTNDFTWIKGDHTFTFGTHNEFFEFNNLFIQDAFGSYDFSSLANLEAGVAQSYFYTSVVPGQPDAQIFKVDQIGLYAGDEWTAKPNLTLTYGIRVDIPNMPDTPSRNPFTEATYGYRTDAIPDGNKLVQPRLGFNWDIGGEGTQQLRGGVGVFAGRTPYVWISNSYARTGLEQSSLSVFGSIPFEPNPNNQPPVSGTGSTGEFNLIDPDFEFPQVLRYNLAYDRELPWLGLIGTAEFVYGDSLEEIDYQDVNIEQVDTNSFDGRPVFAKVDPTVSGAYLIKNTSKGEATNFALKIERPYRRDGVWGFVSYTYGDSTVVNDGSSSRAVSNFQFNEALDPNHAGASTSDYEVEHRFNASLGYVFNPDSKFATTVTAFYNHQSGRPYMHLYSMPSGPTINGDFYRSNDLIYVPGSADDFTLVGGTWDQLDSFISSDACLDKYRGKIMPRNVCTSPWSHTLDLRIAQDLPVRNSHLQLTLDVLNLVNLFDSEAGVLKYVNFGAISPYRWLENDADGKPVVLLFSQVTDPENNPIFSTHNLQSRWRAKLGIRWTF
jgi:Carboxypeptidase regulatory-like domain